MPNCGDPLTWAEAPLLPALVLVFGRSQLSHSLGLVMVTTFLYHFWTVSEAPGTDLPLEAKETSPMIT